MSTANPAPSVPSIGERFNPLAGEQLENPYPFYEQARREEPVFFSTALRMWLSYNQNLWITHPFEGAAYLPR